MKFFISLCLSGFFAYAAYLLYPDGILNMPISSLTIEHLLRFLGSIAGGIAAVTSLFGSSSEH